MMNLDDLPLTPIRTVCLPEGDVVYTTRALVKDSWLTYSDAMPPDDGSWADLTTEVHHNIVGLADALTKFHRSLRDHWKACDESPFVVTRWWDPEATDGYETGAYCLFRFEGMTVHELINSLPRKLSLKLTQVSERSLHFATATLTMEQHQLSILTQDMNEGCTTGLGRAAALA